MLEASESLSRPPGRAKTFSTESMAAMDSKASVQFNSSDAITALDKHGDNGNWTMFWPRSVIKPFLKYKKLSQNATLDYAVDKY